MLRAWAESLVKDLRPAYAVAGALLSAALLAAGLWPALLLVPLALELAFRVLLRLAYGPAYLYRVRPYLLVDHPVYGYGLRPGADTTALEFPLYEKYAFRPGAGLIHDEARNRAERIAIRVNARGFRGPELASPKAPGTLRVFCSGGSTTAGHCVAEGETWPARLQEGLAARGVKAEVVNAGVYGWDSYQELLRLKEEILRLEPDVVLLHQGWNEEFNFSSLDLGRAYRPKVARGYYDKYFFYTNPSPLLPRRFLTWVLLRRELGRERMLREKMAFDVPARWETLKSREYPRAWFDNIREAAELCAARGVRLYLVDYPCLVTLGEPPREREEAMRGSRLTPLHAAYQACSKARIEHTLSVAGAHVPVLDGAAPFRGLPPEDKRGLFSDELHLTPAGEALLGDAVAQALAGALRREPGLRPEGMGAARERVGVNPKPLAMEIDRARSGLLAGRSGAVSGELPSDRYTNY